MVVERNFIALDQACSTRRRQEVTRKTTIVAARASRVCMFDAKFSWNAEPNG